AVPDGHHKVSYPDAAVLQLADAGRDERVGMVRTLDGLTPGKRYVFYLQLLDPHAGKAEGGLRGMLNEHVVWSSSAAPAPATTPGWRYVVVPWEADDAQVSIRVERRSTHDGDAGFTVRTLHLYPAY